MRSIWKFELTYQDKQSVVMPKDAVVLHVDNQREVICIWCELDPEDKNMRARMFEVFGTGHEINYGMGAKRVYLGTVKLQGGDLVFHVYERIN